LKIRTIYSYVKKYITKFNIIHTRLFKRFFIDNDYFDYLANEIKNFPVSNGSRYYSKINVNVGIIADEFIFESYVLTCNLIYISPDNWKSTLKKIKCLIVTTTWRGLNNEWIKIYDKNSKTNHIINEIIETTKKEGLKVIFYSKEDPPNMKYFLNIAQKCDYIFTSAEECVSEYILKTGNRNCFVLPFAFNPLLYNPISINQKIKSNTALFAGSWMKKYPERIKTQKNLFNIILKNKLILKIIDRNYHIKNTRYVYPYKYIRYVVPSFKYKELSVLYKLHEYVLNFNSVTDSSTMYAARVCDASACGSIIISNYSKGMVKNYPNVYVIENQSELTNLIGIKNKYSMRCDAIRTAFRNGTTFDRINFLLTNCGIDTKKDYRLKIAILISDKCKDKSKIKYMYNLQTYKYKQLFYRISDLQLRNFDFVTIWDDSKNYSEYYIEDMINCFKFTDSDFVTCCSEEESHKYTDFYEDVYETVFSIKNNYSYLSDIFDNNNMKGYSLARSNVIMEVINENVV